MKKKKKKSAKELLLSALGRGARLAYLEKNPHGFSKQTKVSRNKKKYNRKVSKREPFFDLVENTKKAKCEYFNYSRPHQPSFAGRQA